MSSPDLTDTAVAAAAVPIAVLSEPPPPITPLVQQFLSPPPLLPPKALALAYEADQWSPLNVDGQKRYTRQQLLLLRMRPQSQAVPRCKPQLGVLARINLMPMFAKKSMLHPHEHQQQHQAQQHQQRRSHHNQQQQQQHNQQPNHTSHNQNQYHQQQSQQHNQQHGNNAINNSSGSNTGKKNQRNQNRGGGVGGGSSGGASNKNKSNDSKGTDPKPELLHISLTSKEEVKLNETENAWKPRVLLAADHNVPATDQCDELYKKVRSILNKLTFDNFDVLLEQLKNSAIDSMDKLNGVILLVFDKAIDEPKFSRAYAQLCRSLVENCFPVDSGSRKLFKTTLINKCQREFVRNVTGGEGGTEGNAELMRPMREEMAACAAGSERRTELAAALVGTEQRLRRRTVCTVGFIGELYRMEMLTTKIINWCVRVLLESRSEEKLECLCKLLETVGERIETKTGDEQVDDKNYVDLTDYFRQLQHIVDGKSGKMKVSNRVRFMLQDIIDLRSKNWVSRRK